jgi:radical SAM protein with 4Fe4S-binding SPASM domain
MYHVDEIRWDITKRCNLRCKHCYVGPSLTKVTEDDDFGTEHALSIVDKLAREGVKRIQFLGGEPFARPDFRTILKVAASHGIMFLVNTNGTYISAEVADELAAHPRWAVTFSLDGPTAGSNDVIRGKGVFARCVRGIRNLARAKREVHPTQTVAINTVLTDQNIDLISVMFDLAADCGIDVLQFNSMDAQGFALTKGTAAEFGVTAARLLDAALEISERALSHKFEVRQVYAQNITRKYISQQLGIPFEPTYGGCKAGVRGAYINQAGEMFSCSELTYGRYPELANTFAKPLSAKTPMKDVLSSEQFEAMQELRRSKIHRTQYFPCSKCEFQTLCHPCSLPSLKADGGTINLSLCAETHQRMGHFSPELDSCAASGSITDGLCK